MTAISNLQYASRFGAEVARLAQASLSASAGDADAASARYARWFRGNEAAEDGREEGQRNDPLSAAMTSAEIASVTKDNLSKLGDDANRLFSGRLPAGHRMRRAIRSSVLPDMPYFGTCKFGEIVNDRSQDTLSVTQVFVANFHGDIDTASVGNIYRPAAREFDRMFFGIHLVVDRFGTTLGFDHERGKSGLAFKTRNMSEALYSIASASTGLTRDELQARAVRRIAS